MTREIPDDDVIVENVISNREENIEEEEWEDEAEKEPELFNVKDGRMFCENLFSYLQTIDDVPENLFKSLNDISLFVDKNAYNNMKQKKVTDFFKNNI